MLRLALLALFCALTAQLPADTYLVVPFSSLSTDRTLDWIGEGISETVIDALAEGQVLVIGRTELQEGLRNAGIRSTTRLSQASMIKVADTLDSDVVVIGQFDFTPPADPAAPRTNGTLRINAKLINVRTLSPVATISQSGRLADFAKLLNDFCWEILLHANPEHASTRDAYIAEHPPTRVDAVENYVRGLLASAPEQKTRYFAAAAKIDPKFGKPAFELGIMNFNKRQYKVAADWFQQVPSGIRKSHDALFLLGVSRFRLGEYPAAQSAFAKLSLEVPLNEVWNNLGASLSRIGNSDSLAAFQKALEGDPNDADYRFNVGFALLKQNRLQEALPYFQRVLAADPLTPSPRTL